MCCGCECCLCCFKYNSPLCIAITALVLQIVAFIFVIWGAVDFKFVRSYQKSLFWIGFVLSILSFIGIITIFILVLVRKETNYSQIKTVGKITCIVIMVLFPLTNLCFLISSIGTIVDYARIEDKINGYSVIPGRYWASAIVPTVWYIILTAILSKCIKALYIIFNEDIFDTIEKKRIRDAVVPTNQVGITVNQFQPGSTTQGNYNPTNSSTTYQNMPITSANPVDNLNKNNIAVNSMNPGFQKNN